MSPLPSVDSLLKVNWVRRPTQDDSQGNFSDISIVGQVFACVMGELPDRNNQKNISCTAKGTYLGEWLYSPEHKRFLYHLVKFLQPDGTWGPIPGGRDMEEIHVGNVCGDISLGYQSDSKGCGLAGQDVVTFKAGTTLSPTHAPLLKDQLGVSASGPTLTQFHKALQGPDGKMPQYVVFAIS